MSEQIKDDKLRDLMMEECEKILLMIGPKRTDKDLYAVCDSLNRIAAEAMREGAQSMLARTFDHIGGKVQ